MQSKKTDFKGKVLCCDGINALLEELDKHYTDSQYDLILVERDVIIGLIERYAVRR